jgi:ThiF family/Prokaryotic E2 family A
LTRAGGPTISGGQQFALDQLEQIAADHPDLVQVLEHRGMVDHAVRVVVRVATAGVVVAPGGLPVNEDHEDVVVGIGPLFPLLPPMLRVEHNRFVGSAHVLQGHVLCIYLDVVREWHPAVGMTGVLQRLGEWLTDGAAGRFDATRALYHPVGGILHRTRGTPTIVVRTSFTDLTNRNLFRAGIVTRTALRLDLAAWRHSDRPETTPAPVVLTPGPFVYGAGTTLAELLSAITRTGHPTAEAVATYFAHTAARCPAGSRLYFLLGVPNRLARGVDRHHLLAGYLDPDLADALRSLVASRAAFAEFPLEELPKNAPISWCSVSDERPEIATRRDESRPVSAFEGKHVHLWGCGGLGSWIAELLVRAGIANITLCDTGTVTAGLLVRQDYVEHDVGAPKAERLAERLRAIADAVQVEVETGDALGIILSKTLPECDLLIDATVNPIVADALDELAREVDATPVMASVATDVRTATLGLMSVSAQSQAGGPATIDRAASRQVMCDPTLEAFHTFWETPDPGDEVIPSLGCSLPTFRGSAADLACLAGTFITLLGPHLGPEVSGAHLVTAAHAGTSSTAHRFIPIAQT